MVTKPSLFQKGAYTQSFGGKLDNAISRAFDCCFSMLRTVTFCAIISEDIVQQQLAVQSVNEHNSALRSLRHLRGRIISSVASLTIKSRYANISVFIDCENN